MKTITIIYRPGLYRPGLNYPFVVEQTTNTLDVMPGDGLKKEAVEILMADHKVTIKRKKKK